MKLFYLLSLTTLLMSFSIKEDFKKISSPNQGVETIIDVENGLQYSVIYNQDTIIKNSKITLELKGVGLLKDFKIIKTTKNTINNKWERIWGKRKVVTNDYNELKIEMRNKKSGILVDLFVRVYNDGVGLRYGFPKQEKIKSIELVQERMQFSFTKDHKVWRSDYSASQEREFLNVNLSNIKSSEPVGMPLLVQVEDKAFVSITEANLTNWAGAYLITDDTVKNSIVTELSPLPSDTTIVVKRKLPAVSPWRVIMLSKDPGGLIESDLLANLNDPVEGDFSWVKPGASAWDWWWSNKYAPSQDFELGANQETMKYYIDFASKMGWEYQIVDWQWYGEPFANTNIDITTCIKGIDVEELVKYAHSKGVKLIVWVHWKHLNKQMDEAFALYEKWGVSGVKIDFMNRQDQEMVNFYHRVAKKAAQHKLIVDFHGAYKPTGVSRTYPNLITREGVMGNEYTKWSSRVTPEHNVTIPFTRGLLGEMDYTPVSFRNVTPDEFKVETKSKDHSPMVQSTRCHQLAMPVIYESALTVFCDSPDNYSNGIGLEFLKLVPTTWDESKVLNGSVGNYITMARKSGSSWFIGGMTNSNEREIDVDFSFLDDGDYHATIFLDAIDANENPSNATRRETIITNKDNLSFKLAKGGGFTAILEKK